nr:uncharacterized protein LOC109148764 isoform X2 [Ipomoea trifida]
MSQRGADMAKICHNDVRSWPRNTVMMYGLGREMLERGADLADKCRNEVQTLPRNATTKCRLSLEISQCGADMAEKCRNDVRKWSRNVAMRCLLGVDIAEKCRNECIPFPFQPRSSSQQPNPSSQPIPESPQAIPESQPILDSAPENPFDEIHEGNDFVYNDETENAFVEVEVGDGESDNPENLPDESDNPENSSHEVQLGDEVVQLVQVPFLRESMTNQVRKATREDRAIQQPPTAKKQKTLGLKRQVNTKHVATRKYRTRSTVVFKSKFNGNLSEPIELD